MPYNVKILEYNQEVWEEIPTKAVNTLQLFITNRCNLRCTACFYSKKLGKEEMGIEDYRKQVSENLKGIEKVILLGGEPTLHSKLEDLISFNRNQGLKTTIYTNGYKLKRLENFDLEKNTVRIGVYGSYSSEKPLSKIEKTSVPATIVYMLRNDNVHELMEAAKIAEEFNCKRFFISSIRDIMQTRDYWKDNENTLPLDEYSNIVQDFVNNYDGNLELHIARRGVLKSKKYSTKVDKCRFGNVFPNGKKIICPFDISLEKYSDNLIFGKRKCNKNDNCLLTKIVLKRK
ncbi:MAG: radical SAM protein [Candidatus Woesearchaeota archaeon]